MMTEPFDVLIFEAGGSHTAAALYRGGSTIVGREVLRSEGPTSNPRSVGADDAYETLDRVLRPVLAQLTGPVAIYGAHGAASTRFEADQVAAWLRERLRDAAIVRLVVANDLTPLALGSPAADVVVAAAGTGTGFVGRSRDGRWARASGHEFILTDEGGAFALGQQVLRAAIRDVDGRGEATALTGLVRATLPERTGDLAGALFTIIHSEPRRLKLAVAAFAPLAFRAAEAGDPVAHRLVDDAATEILTGISAIDRRLGLNPGTSRLVLTGALVTVESAVRTRVLQSVGHREVEVLGPDLLGPVLNLRRHFACLAGEARTHRWLPVHIGGGELCPQ